MLELFRSLRRNRRLLKEFVVRDLKARYVGSSMGFFWSVVFPIINLFVYMFVFRLVLNARWSDSQGSSEVAIVMLAGIVVWSAFGETVSRATNSLVENSNLIQKVVFPSEVLPTYLTISSLINMAVGIPVVLACVIWFAYFSPPTLLLGDGAQVVGEHIADAHGAGAATVILVSVQPGHRSDISIPFSVAGTATPGSDFAIDASPLVIPAGRTFGEIRVVPVPDGEVEGDETLLVRFGDPSSGSFGGAREHSVTFGDGRVDPPPRGARTVDPTYHPLNVGPSLLILPFLFLIQLCFTAGLGYFLATLNLFLRDTFHLVGVFITVWMFGTPIFYPASLVVNADFGWMLAINPMHWLIECYRNVLCYGQWPAPALLLRLTLVGLLVLTIGSRFFLSQKQRFPDML